jgi:TetR/AcrR family transcriptional repressor of bet genes
MKPAKISEIRRQELRRAAYEVLQTEGMGGATVEKVALQAGTSKGIVHHYFKTKKQLFEHAMRYSNASLRDGVIKLMRQARTPDERLWAIIEGNFLTDLFTPAICNAWFALCAEVPREPQLARIQQVVHARMRSNLMSALTELVPAEQCETVALALSSLIDGLWLRSGLHPGELTAQAALAQIADYLTHRIPRIDWNEHLRRAGATA